MEKCSPLLFVFTTCNNCISFVFLGIQQKFITRYKMNPLLYLNQNKFWFHEYCLRFLLIYKFQRCVKPLKNKFLFLLSPPTILNGFLENLVFWNLEINLSKMVQKNSGKIWIPGRNPGFCDRKRFWQKILDVFPDFGFLLHQVTQGDLRITKN